MATISLANLGSSDVGQPTGFTTVGHVYVEVREIDFADAVTEKGSALAQGDVITAIPVPEDCLLLGGGLKVTEAHAGTSTDLTLDVGVTGGTVDALVDGFDFDGASVGDTVLANPMEVQYVTANDTVDILLTTMTGTTTGGKVLVYAIIAPVGPEMAKAPGRVLLGT